MVIAAACGRFSSELAVISVSVTKCETLVEGEALTTVMLFIVVRSTELLWKLINCVNSYPAVRKTWWVESIQLFTYEKTKSVGISWWSLQSLAVILFTSEKLIYSLLWAFSGHYQVLICLLMSEILTIMPVIYLELICMAWTCVLC